MPRPYRLGMFGRPENPANKALPDLNLREFATFAPLIVLAFWIGIYPSFFTRYLDQPVNAIVEKVRTGYFEAARLPAPPALVAERAAPK